MSNPHLYFAIVLIFGSTHCALCLYIPFGPLNIPFSFLTEFGAPLIWLFGAGGKPLSISKGNGKGAVAVLFVVPLVLVPVCNGICSFCDAGAGANFAWGMVVTCLGAIFILVCLFSSGAGINVGIW